MYKIQVQEIKSFPEAQFQVEVQGEQTTTHTVNLSENYYDKLTSSKISVQELIKKSFEFLLERESNTSILREFDLTVISTYFPEFETIIKT